jgi:protein-S-isoprenylcysteine O-methyltransferase Ste14
VPADPIANQTRTRIKVGRLLKRLAQVLVAVAALAAMLFLSSWRLDWVMAWVYVGAFAVVLTAMTVYQELGNPALVEERSEFKPREGVQTWDVILSAVVRVSLLASYVVAGLDVRLGWKPEIPLAIQIAAFALGLLGAGLIVWAMAANRYAVVYARIQQERGHSVATTGPYRFVRHPFYVGAIIFSPTIPLALGSPWALIPGGLAALLFVAKTAAEDRMLRAGLPGYADYAQRTRYRLLPGVW